MNINDLVYTDLVKTRKENIIRYKEVKCLCSRKYPRHNKGCPNIEKCKNIPFFDDIKRTETRYYYLLFANFNYEKYQELRKLDNPSLTMNQVRCVLYWQNSIKKILKQRIEYLVENNSLYYDDKDVYILGCGSGFKLSFQDEVYSMESTGINVFSTLKLNNIEFDLKAIKNVKLVCLICSNYKLKVL